MARVIFVNRYFFPDHSATSQILSDLTFHFAAAGHEVHVITSKQIYDEPDADLSGSEIINQVNVHSSTRFGRSALAGRALDYLSFYHSVRRRLAEITRAGDIVVAKTDPPLLSIAVAPIARQRRLHLITWLQDIYPETATVLGVPLIRGPAASALARLRNHGLRHADAIVVVGELMARRIQAQEVEAARIHVITNWCDDETIKPIAQANNSPRETWQLAGKFVVGYSGNLIAAGLASRQAKLRLWLQSCDNGHRNRRPLQKWASIRGEWKFTRRGSLARWSQLLDQVIAS